MPAAGESDIFCDRSFHGRKTAHTHCVCGQDGPLPVVAYQSHVFAVDGQKFLRVGTGSQNILRRVVALGQPVYVIDCVKGATGRFMMAKIAGRNSR